MNCTIEDAIKEVKDQIGKKLPDALVKALESIMKEIDSNKVRIAEDYKEAEMLFSTQDTTISELDKVDKVYESIQEDPKKIMDIFDKLKDLDKVGLSEEHRAYLRDVLDTFVNDSEQFLRELSIKINEKYSGDNQGAFNLKKGEIYLGIGMNDPDSANKMSMEEVYVHEIVHAATEYARTQNKAEVTHAIKMIDRMYEQAMKAVKPNKDLSQETLDYIFDRKAHGTAEFIAYALTNEAFRKELNKLDIKPHEKEAETFTELVFNLFKRIVNVLLGLDRGATGMKVDEAMTKFSIELARANNHLANEVRKGMIQKATDSINVVDEKASKYLERIIGKYENDSYLELYGKYGKIRGTLAAGWKFLGDKEAKDNLLWWLDKSGVGIFDMRGSIQTIIRHMRDKDPYDVLIQNMSLKSNTIEQAKRKREMSLTVLAKGGFKRLEREEDTALGHTVVETDMSSLKEYETEQLLEFIKSDDAINKEIESIFSQLDEKDKIKNIYRVKLDGLGQYMATGVTNVIGIAMNTKTLINMHEGSMEYQSDLDKIASLYALKHTSTEARKISAEVMEREPDAVRNLMEIQDSLKETARKHLFSKESDYKGSQEIQGYVRDILNPDYDVRIEPASMREKMLREGYKRVEVLKKSKYDSSGVIMAVYVSNEAAKQPWHRATIGMTDNGRRGTTFTDVHVGNHGLSGYLSAEEDIEKYRKAVKAAEKQMANGTYRAEEGAIPIPVRDMDGNIIDVRYTMSKASKTKYMQRDARATQTLARTGSTALEKALLERFNLDVVDLLIHDMNTMMTDENKDRYIEISPDSTDEEVKELYKILPEYFKRYLDEKLENYDPSMPRNNLYVRKDVYRQVFGYRELSLVNGLDHTRDAYKTIRLVIRFAEKYWKWLVSIAKVDIIIKTPVVLIGNVLSNFLYAVMNGIPIDQVYRNHMDAIELLKDYLDTQTELDKLRVKESIKKTKAGQKMISEMEAKLEASSIHPMMEAGLFTNIIEDVELTEVEDPNRLVRKIDAFMERTPQFVRVGADWLFMTKRSPLFQAMNKATQYSDFLSRYTMLQHYLKEGQKNGMSYDKALKWGLTEAIEDFINYDVVDSKMVEYLNKMGVMMFTKYMIRIQKVIRKGIVKHPIQFISALMGQAVLWDINDITDSTIGINKNPLENYMGPVDVMKNALTPSGYELVAKYLK